jgi:K+-transporting ATPase ATPase A chain
MTALTVQNFASAAAGMAVAIAVTRGFARQQVNSLGNFWVDLTRGTIYVLLPIAFVVALFFCSQGVIQNFHPYTTVTTLEGVKQVIAQGPVASQEAIKLLGTNGGGFFHANSAHPFENPTPLTNFVQMILMFLIPAGLTHTFGRMVGDRRQGWAIFSACAVLFLAGAFFCYWAEQRGTPMLARAGVQMHATTTQPGGNMEGKETRFGIAASALFATVATDTSSGAVNAMHDSFTPLGGLVPLFNIETGEVIFGGDGAGLYGLLLYVMLTVFIVGLLVGRTPEYVGKRIEQKEIKMSMLALVAVAFSIFVFTGAAAMTSAANLGNPGAHGFTETLYAYSSAARNDGSAFRGLNANTPWYNLTLGLAMLMGRFLFIVPLMGAAGSLAMKRKTAQTPGTFQTHRPLFVMLLIGTVIFFGALTFFPALALGPIVEQFLMEQGSPLSSLLLLWGV